MERDRLIHYERIFDNPAEEHAGESKCIPCPPLLLLLCAFHPSALKSRTRLFPFVFLQPARGAKLWKYISTGRGGFFPISAVWNENWIFDKFYLACPGCTRNGAPFFVPVRHSAVKTVSPRFDGILNEKRKREKEKNVSQHPVTFRRFCSTSAKRFERSRKCVSRRDPKSNRNYECNLARVWPFSRPREKRNEKERTKRRERIEGT